MFNSKGKLLSLKWYPDYNWPWGICSTWNIGHSLQVQRGAAPLRLNNQSGHINCLFRQIELSLMPLKWKTLRFITWVNLMFYLYCNVFYCDVMYCGSGQKRKGQPGLLLYSTCILGWNLLLLLVCGFADLPALLLGFKVDLVFILYISTCFCCIW